jgi:hypothetical protein
MSCEEDEVALKLQKVKNYENEKIKIKLKPN